jgi:hypothetical protein
MKRILTLVVVLFMVSACKVSNSKKQSDISRLSWLLGNWWCENGEMVIEEKWVMGGDTMMLGSSKTMANNDLMSSETVVIKLVNDTLFYEVTVNNQNNGKPVFFKMVNINDTLVRFENKHHDFPTRIEYKKLSDSTCLAKISGMIKGEERSVDFNYRRTN